jgi:hypothetical protein
MNRIIMLGILALILLYQLAEALTHKWVARRRWCVIHHGKG